METLWEDLKYGSRILFKRPGMAFLAVLALSVSIGMTTQTFSVLNGILFKGLPFPEADRLFTIYRTASGKVGEELAIPRQDLSRLTGQLDCFESMSGMYAGTINLSGDGLPMRYTGTFVSANILETLGVGTQLGQGFSRDGRDGTHGQLLISDRVWRDRYRGDPGILNQVVRVNGEERSIAGIMPEGFHFPVNSDIWIPLETVSRHTTQGKEVGLEVIGRLRADSSREAAETAIAALSETLYESTPTLAGPPAKLALHPFGRAVWKSGSAYLTGLGLMVTFFILLIACANVANLLIGRASVRGREMAIRSALGATRWRIVRQLLTESLIIAALGSVGGTIYAAWTVDLTWNIYSENLPQWMNFEIDWRVFVFVLGVMILTTFLAGVIPAWQASRIDLNEMLKDSSRTSTSFRLGRFTRMLTVVQIAFSCALLFGAGLTMRNVMNLSSIDPGYEAEKILTARMALFESDYPTAEARDTFYRELIESLQGQPGVEQAAITSWISQWGNFRAPVQLGSAQAAGETSLRTAYFETVSPTYFETIGTDRLSGRGFTGEDVADAPTVVVVNRAFVEEFLPAGSEVIGESVTLFVSPMAQTEVSAETATIVGVVDDVVTSGLQFGSKSSNATVYAVNTQRPSEFMTLMVRSRSGDPHELLPLIQQKILALDPHLPIYFAKTMDEFIDEQIVVYRMMSEAFLTIGLMALFLATVGVYGMMAFTVTSRRQEIGIRMAIGAQRRQILDLVLRQGILQMVIGICIGLGLAYLIGRIIRALVSNIEAADGLTFILSLFILTAVTFTACILPARRATRLSPMEALRHE